MRIDISSKILSSWQELLNLAAEIFQVPAALIMRLEDPYIEVLAASSSEGNPYTPGSREEVWDSGLYCEKVIRSREPLEVAYAPAEAQWKDNPDIKLDMVSYLGYPIFLPDSKPFGTICVLDTKEHAYAPAFRDLLGKFRDIIENDLELLHINQTLGDTNKRMAEYLGELQHLRGVVSICAYCKDIKDQGGTWQPVEKFLIGHPGAGFSHGICPVCLKKQME